MTKEQDMILAREVAAEITLTLWPNLEHADAARDEIAGKIAPIIARAIERGDHHDRNG